MFEEIKNIKDIKCIIIYDEWAEKHLNIPIKIIRYVGGSGLKNCYWFVFKKSPVGQQLTNLIKKLIQMELQNPMVLIMMP